MKQCTVNYNTFAKTRCILLCTPLMHLRQPKSDEAGPFQTVPYPGKNWQPAREPQKQPHEYIRNGTAKLLTLFHTAIGEVRVKDVTSCTNAVLHPWLKEQLTEILNALLENQPWIQKPIALPGWCGKTLYPTLYRYQKNYRNCVCC